MLVIFTMVINVRNRYITNKSVINSVGELYNLINGIDDSVWGWMVLNIIMSEFIICDIHNEVSVIVINKIDMDIKVKDVIMYLIGIVSISLEARLVM